MIGDFKIFYLLCITHFKEKIISCLLLRILSAERKNKQKDHFNKKSSSLVHVTESLRLNTEPMWIQVLKLKSSGIFAFSLCSSVASHACLPASPVRPLGVLFFSSLGQALPPRRERASSCGCLSFNHTSSPAAPWPGTQESPGFTSNCKHLSLNKCRYFQCLDLTLGLKFFGTDIDDELLQLLKHKFTIFDEFGCANVKQHETYWSVRSSGP